MTPESALQYVQQRFPFEGYFAFDKGYLESANVVKRYLSPGARILDFGAGPADRTAILTAMGYKCFAYDDLEDYWHLVGDNRSKILAFAAEFGIDYQLANGGPPPYKSGEFDMLILQDVIEHLHDSPRDLLNTGLEFVRPEGFLFITVPSAVNIRKRLHVLMGKSNLPSYEKFYWNPGQWRGHVREYVRDDCKKLANYLGLEVLELRGCHQMLHRVPTSVRPLYKVVTTLFPDWRDTWLMVAKKRPGWEPKNELPQDELFEMLGRQSRVHYESSAGSEDA